MKDTSLVGSQGKSPRSEEGKSTGVEEISSMVFKKKIIQNIGGANVPRFNKISSHIHFELIEFHFPLISVVTLTLNVGSLTSIIILLLYIYKR